MGQDTERPSAAPLNSRSRRKRGGFFNKFFNFLFICFWLRWVFLAAHGLPLVVASGGYSSLRCVGFSLQWLLLLRSTGSRCKGCSSCGTWASVVVVRGLQSIGSVVAAHGLSCSTACGIFPDQGSNLCPLHWQEDSSPLRHQGSPGIVFGNECPEAWVLLSSPNPHQEEDPPRSQGL